MERKDVHMWRDYERGKVGVEIDDERRLLDPDRARAHATILEERSSDEILRDGEFTQFLDNLRQYASDVE